MTDEVDKAESGYNAQIHSAVQTERWGFNDVLLGMLAAFLLSNIVGALIYSAAGWKSSGDVPVWGFGVLQIPLWAGYLAILVIAGNKGSGVRDAFGLRADQWDPVVGIAIGIACQLLILPLLYVPVFKLTGTDSDQLSKPARELASRAQGTWSWVLFAILVGLVAPVVEELFFRGLMLRSLSKHGYAPVLAVVVSGAIFAALHFQPLQFAGLMAFGVILAVMTVVTGRLGPAIFAHMGFNATTVVVLYLDYRSRTR